MLLRALFELLVAVEFSRVNDVKHVAVLALRDDSVSRLELPLLHSVDDNICLLLLETSEQEALFEPQQNSLLSFFRFGDDSGLEILLFVVVAVDLGADSSTGPAAFGCRLHRCLLLDGLAIRLVTGHQMIVGLVDLRLEPVLAKVRQVLFGRPRPEQVGHKLFN